MALHTLGTKGTAQLSALAGWSQVLSPADIAAIGNGVASDFGFGTVSGQVAGVQYVLATATTAGSTTLTVVTARTGSPPITQIHVGDAVLGSAADITPGTYVTAISGTTVTISQAAISTGATKAVAFARQDGSAGLDGYDQLLIPNRGILKMLPGDVAALDSSGWPILVSGNSISYLGSDWTFT